MYLYRALNDNDLSTLSLNEGLYSKEITDYFKLKAFDLFLSANSDLYNQFSKLSKDGKKITYKSYMHDFTFDVIELRNLANIISSKVKIETMDDITVKKSGIYSALRTVNNHLVNGSKYNTNWISFTKDIHRIEKYYLKQKINKVAVLDSNLKMKNLELSYDLIIDCNTLGLDFSDRKTVKFLLEQHLLPNKDDKTTKETFRGLNYAIKDKEVIYYSHVPQEKIVTVLEPIQVDLIYNDLLNENFYKLDNDAKLDVYRIFKETIEKLLLEDLSDIEKMVLLEHYFNSQPLSSLYNNACDADKFVFAKKKILSKIPINQVTGRIMKGKCQNIILPEEKRYSK